ncbi:porin [Paraburkholderia silviterrae]|uniref:Porin n=1 Tax=Paraburkholderia silviterrae TaxID=2528715 RepID=A0A4R5M9R9_9BURK|nr:porin [Paraburkholderia silviterrae]TDG23376.1 porin [Paraburkholderia silviterrae]
MSASRLSMRRSPESGRTRIRTFSTGLRPAHLACTVAAVTLGAASFTARADTSNLFLFDYLQGLPYATSAAYSPGVTLYGVVDDSIGYTKGAHSAFVQQSGGEWTSKVGLYGVEDLGDGYWVRFALESGFNTATGQQGSPGTLFNREAWIGLGSKRTGELKFGLQDDVGVPLFVDVFGEVGSVSAVGYLLQWTSDLGPGASYEPGRLPSAISYASPWFGPLNAQFAVVLHGAQPAAPTFATRSAALNYFDGHLFATLAYIGNYGQNALVPSQYVRTDNYAAGVFYDGGHYVLSAGYSFLAPRLDGDRTASVYSVGAIYRYRQRNDFRVELAYRTVSGFNDRSLGLTLGYDYNLSARTALYVRGSLVHNTGSAPVYGNEATQQPTVDNIGNAYTGPGGVMQNYRSPHVVLVGMYHKF